MLKRIMPLLLSLVLLAGCSSSSDLAYYSNEVKSENAAGATASDSIMYDYAEEEVGEYYDISTPSLTQSVSASYEKKIIRSASITITATDVEDAYAKILEYIKANGGYEFSGNVRKGNYTSVVSSIRIKPENLDTTLEFIAECGELNNQNISSDDITDSYYDAEIRLESKRKSLEKYYEFLELAETIEDVIALQNQIDYITADIEAYEGRLKMWDSLTNETSISIYINQKVDPITDTEDIDWNALDWSDMGKLISNGFKSVVNTLVSFLQWLIIAIISISPILVIAAIIVVIIVVSSKRRKARKLKATEVATPQADAPTEDNNIS